MNPNAHDEELDPIEPDLGGIAIRLREERPHPSASFRAGVRRQLQMQNGDRRTDRGPALQIAGYLSGGVILLLVAAVGLGGLGPFAS